MVDAAPSAWNPANLLTVLRIVLVPVFVVALMWDHGENVAMRLVALALFLLAAATDRVDGWLARRNNLVTDLGKLLDPIADKLLMGAALICLSLLGDLKWWVTVVILVRELGITVMRFFLLRYLVLPASKGGKAKTVLQTAAISMFLLPLSHLPQWVSIVAWVLMIAAVVLTVVTGLDYVRTAMRVWRDAAALRAKAGPGGPASGGSAATGGGAASGGTTNGSSGAPGSASPAAGPVGG